MVASSDGLAEKAIMISSTEIVTGRVYESVNKFDLIFATHV